MTRNSAPRAEPKVDAAPQVAPPKRATAQTASDEPREVRSLVRVVHDGEIYEPGTSFKIGGKQLRALLDIKAVQTI